MSDVKNLKAYSLQTAIGQINACDFQCEAGPLSHNMAWRWIEEAKKSGPEFWPGQYVWFLVKANVGDIELTKWVYLCIVGCRMKSTPDSQYWVYDLSGDPPRPYHYGTTDFSDIDSSRLSLKSPLATGVTQ